MIISTSNSIKNNTPALIAGSISSGTLIDMLSPDFSKVVSTASTTFTFTVGSVVGCEYIGLHGLKLPQGSNITVSAAGYTDTFITVNATDRNVVFYVGDVSLDNLQVSITGNGTKTISYMQAGSATVVPWGTNAGQSLYYLGYNTKNRTGTNNMGAPVIRTQETIAPKLKLNINNVTKTWARNDLKAIFNHYQSNGILSILDYENDDRFNESVAGFNLTGGDVKTHSQTLLLCDVSLSMQVSV